MEALPETAYPQRPEPLTPAAYYGIIDDLIDIIREHSEADEAALIVPFLIATRSPLDQIHDAPAAVPLLDVLLPPSTTIRIEEHRKDRPSPQALLRGGIRRVQERLLGAEPVPKANALGGYALQSDGQLGC